MSSFQIHQDKGCLSSTRLNNRLLYFISLRLPLNSSYFNRALVNHFDILTTRSQPVKKINTSEVTLKENVQRNFQFHEIDIGEIRTNSSFSDIVSEIDVLELEVDELESQIRNQVITDIIMTSVAVIFFGILIFVGLRRLKDATMKLKKKLNDIAPLL